MFDHGAAPEAETTSSVAGGSPGPEAGARPRPVAAAGARAGAERPLQPLLHDLVGAVLAPSSALGGADGQIRAAGAQGLFHADSRALSLAVLRVDGHEPEPIGHALTGPGGARFVSLLRRLGDPGPDPTVRVDRARQVTAGGMAETIEIVSSASVPVAGTVTLALGCDFAPIEVVKSGGAPVSAPAAGGAPGTLSWTSGRIRVRVTGHDGALAEPAQRHAEGRAEAAPDDHAVSRDGHVLVRPDRGAGVLTEGPDGAAEGGRLRWDVELPPRGRVRLRWEVAVHDPEAVVTAPTGPVEWSRPSVAAADHRLPRLLDQSLDDLVSLRLAEAGAPADTFLGAGVPWFLTLFGRDSIWAARMLLPLGTGLAAGTLRVLARRQGLRAGPASGEAPGKIMHELRRHEFALGADGPRLPAAYYGTIDATPLWVSLLHDAWRWGMPEADVAELLPAMEAALGWLGGDADADGDGFLEYIDTTGRGLANQGWKDSGDSVRFRDGRQAEPPIALAEVQGYAYEAARHAAALLEAFGRPGAARWSEYADAMAERFRARFWVEGPHGRYPALALDRDKRPVDALTSNIGHLLGTGLLSEHESADVANLLGSPAMAGAFGLRTMSAEDGAYSPLSYHCGSVWAHDTAIVVSGLARAGFGTHAARLAEGLLAAGESYGYRLPELFAGDEREAVVRPVPYPAACRPQAWSAAAAVAVLHAAVGLYPDVPGGRVALRPMAGAPLGAITARGLRVAGADVAVTVAPDGTAVLTGLPPGLSLA
ncbi:glycogen debranching N-terminal domain-containing protein [Sphaerisporangium sp. TRM90804]|uniref:amylo-alpha-1,6-glucosidase n=1 Tax=Sphaerisporangium sp. TRM90804 TaxID=3031113 RepID=UPI002449E867|nr:glycogen debranching N-terminal domain-containing protein [Sphaerisporangium sp. TRM90804]MDH2427457.1 glycogen debranching N-terminal domain-containing protein [Sphaerisporangium sp. TRM90804]